MSRLTINSNIFSLNAQRRLGEATNKLSESYTKLSSGLRINKASDDAAGLSVSSLLTIDRRVTNQGIRNLNDGVSYLNIAESALNELSSIVTRISELAEQGANGTLGSKQREALQQEVTSLQSEYNRIIRTTKFNGNNILTGSGSNIILQGGYGIESQLNIQIGKVIETIPLISDINVDSNGVQGNGSVYYNSLLSQNGRYVAFTSESSNLTQNDTNSTGDVFLRDLQTGEVRRVSEEANGSQLNLYSYVNAISSDGRYIVFTSSEYNGSANNYTIYKKDTINGNLTALASGSQTDDPYDSDFYPSFVGMSENGQYVAIQDNGNFGGFYSVSHGQVLDTVNGGSMTMVQSPTYDPGEGSYIESISHDGRFILWSDNYSTRHLYDRLGQYSSIDDIFSSSSGTPANNSSGNARFSLDNRYVVFNSNATNLVIGDTNGVEDTFIKDLNTGETKLVSSSVNGTISNASSYLNGISSDGRYVFFTSAASNLIQNDTNGANDSFSKDMLTGVVSRVSVDINGNQLPTSSYLYSVSGNGNYATFTNGGIHYLRRLFEQEESGIEELANISISSQSSAIQAIDETRNILNELSGYKANIGASLSRATSFINTLRVQSENYAAAASQITDVDVAEESSKLTANQILQQAAASVLAQANLQPRLVLKLLQDI